MATIKVTPEILKSQGDDLVNFAVALAEELKGIDSEISLLDEIWSGVAEEAYEDMYAKMKTNLDQFPELVKTLGEATISSAEAFGDTDDALKAAYNKATQ